MNETAAQLHPDLDPNKDPNNPAFDGIRQDIERLLKDGEITMRQLARESGSNESSINQFMNRKVGNVRYDRVADRITTWQETRERRAAAQAEFPDAPVFQHTHTAGQIYNVLMYAHHSPDMAVIHGAAGVGKTVTARAYQSENAGVCVATISNATSSVFNSLKEISKCLGIKNTRSKMDLFDAICNELKHTRGLLIIDEAHELSAPAIDQIRHIHDRAGIGVVFMGNDKIYTGMAGGRQADYLDRVYSRVGMWHPLKAVAQADIDNLLDAWNIQEQASRRLLGEVARKPGALRLMTKIIRMARVFAGAGPLEAKHIRAARSKSGRAAQ